MKHELFRGDSSHTDITHETTERWEKLNELFREETYHKFWEAAIL